MKKAVCLVLAVSALTVLMGLAVVWFMFVPVPTDDLLDMTGQMMANGGWRGFGIGPLLTHHNEHRLILTRLAVLGDLAFFEGRQTLLIGLILSSALVTAALLTALARGIGFSKWPLLAFSAMALATAFSPVQIDNLIRGFQVQFVQVWMFAILSFAVLSLAPQARDGQNWAHRLLAVVVAVQAGLLSTYSMKNGLIVWPLLVVLSLWLRLGWRMALSLAAIGACVIAGELIDFTLAPGHPDPIESLSQPVMVARYVIRYLSSGVAQIGTTGQDILGGLALLAVLVLSLESCVRRNRFTASHGVLMATAGFLIGSAFVTALGRVELGLLQANTSRYTTPSLIFLWVVAALLIHRIVGNPREETAPGPNALPALIGVAAVVLYVPGLISTVSNWNSFAEERDMKLQAAGVFLAGGVAPDILQHVYPHTNQVPARAFGFLRRAHKGPFTDTGMLASYAPKRGEIIALPELKCAGRVDSLRADPRQGLRVFGWMAWPDRDALDAGRPIAGSEQPALAVVTDEAGRVIGWGLNLGPAESPLQDRISGSSTRRFVAVGPLIGKPPALIRVLGLSKDRDRVCLLGEPRPPAPRFVSNLSPLPEPVESGDWHVTEGVVVDKSNGAVEITTPLEGAIDLAWVGIPVRPGRVLGVPIRTHGAYPHGMKIELIVASTGAVLVSLPIHMSENPNLLWALFPEVEDLTQNDDSLTVRVSMPSQLFSVGLELGRPAWALPTVQ